MHGPANVKLYACWCRRHFNVYWLFTVTQRDKHKLLTLFDPLSKRFIATHRQLLTRLHIFMCCRPCILVIFDFVFQLNALLVYYIFLIFLYMFRAILCSSSGGSTVYTQHLVLYMSLFLCDRSVHR